MPVVQSSAVLRRQEEFDHLLLKFKLGSTHREDAARLTVQEQFRPGASALTSSRTVLQAWRAQLRAQAALGRRAVTVARLASLANCPPSCVAVSRPLRLCGNAWICPFCYGREIEAVMDKIKQVHACTDDVRAFVYRTTKVYDAPPDAWLPAWLKQRLRTAVAARTVLANAVGQLGGFQKITVVPIVDSVGTAFEVSRRGVLLFRDAAWYKSSCARVDEYDVSDGLTAVELRPLIAKHFAYPTGLLAADPKLLEVVWQAREHIKLSASYGAFRKSCR